MTIPYFMLNRRLFLKLSLSLLGLFINLWPKSIGVTQAHYPSVLGGYDAGTYNQGEYPGYKIYLSLITKEDK